MRAPRMIAALALLVAVIVSTPSLAAAPHVAGYERLYSRKPAAEGGVLLLLELGCVRCHAGGDGLEAPPAPNLSGVGNRLQADWLKAFLAEPSGTQPGGLMPDILHHLPSRRKTAGCRSA